MFGCNLSPPEITCTRCSTAADTAEIAAHFLNSNGLSSADVASMNDSIQDRHLRSALPLVASLIFFKAVRVAVTIVTLVPAYFAIIRYGQTSTVLEGNGLDEVSLDCRNDFIF